MKENSNLRQDIYFMPLGGGQRVGASCYFLRIGKSNIILDAGIGIENDIRYGPDFRMLMTSSFIQSINQINQIYISHAHLDHIGYLTQLVQQTHHATVYMTEITKYLAELQLYDRLYFNKMANHENERLATQYLLEKMMIVSYMQTLKFPNFNVTFYRAGHIPGAMMILFDTGQKKILYTGDYSLNDTLLTKGCSIPNEYAIDTLIMCGLHAKHPNYRKQTNKLSHIVKYVLTKVIENQRSILCYVPQLSKGIEFVKELNQCNASHIPIYLDVTIMNVVEKMERLRIPILNQDNKTMQDDRPNRPHIYVTSKKQNKRLGMYQEVQVDFSLHEDFLGMTQFIKKINPKQAVIVHCDKNVVQDDITIEQKLMLDSESQTQFIFAEEKGIYQL